MRYLLLVLLAGCAAEPERMPRIYCMNTPWDRIEYDREKRELKYACDRWCDTHGGCLCKETCPCKADEKK